MFFVYVHCKPDYSIFYIGKGKKKRVYDMVHNRNKYHKNITNKYGKENIAIGKIECSSEEIAFSLEIGLIKCARKSGLSIANMTDGGEGKSGCIASAETRKKISDQVKSRVVSEETRKKMSVSFTGRKMSESAKEKMRNVDRSYLKAYSGENHPSFGKKQSVETIEKRVALVRGKKKPRTNCSVCDKSVSNNVLHRFHEENCSAFANYTTGRAE